MPGRVLRHPFAVGFALTLLVSVVLLLLLAPTTGWAQGPVGSKDQGWIPIQGGDEPRSPVPVVPWRASPSTTMETPGRKAPPAVAGDGNRQANGRQGPSDQSVGEELRGALAPSGPGAYSSPLIISAADFRNNGLSTDRYLIILGEGGYGGYFTPSSGIVCMMAPAHLPVLTRITQMSTTFYDNGGAQRPWLRLLRIDNFNAILMPEVMGDIKSPGTSVNLQTLNDLNVVNPVVIQPQWSYYVGGCLFDTQQRIYSVQLYYTWP